MIIKYIELNNFRQFLGNQKIEFSFDKEKKATLIIAKNTTGKTTLLEAFSWIFYGRCNLKTVRNNEIENKLNPGKTEEVSGEVCLDHGGKEYRIFRSFNFHKVNSKIINDNDFFRIYIKDNKGITSEVAGVEANNLINEIVPNKLFPYFFFKGENIERIGKEISKDGTNSKNSEFVKAIKGMLGFDYLYQTENDLQKLIVQYENEIEKNNVDSKIAGIQKRINDSALRLSKLEEDFSENENNLEIYNEEKTKISNEIAASGDASEKQKVALQLEAKIRNFENKIKDQERLIFSKFSSKAYWLFASDLIKKSTELLNSNSNIDKGIPGLNAIAIQAILEKGECLCGTKFKKGDSHWTALNDWIKYLPPYNLGAEISKYKAVVKPYLEKGEEFYSDFLAMRTQLDELKRELSSNINNLDSINKAIKNLPDMSKKKDREIELISKISSCIEKRGNLKYQIDNEKNVKAVAEKEKSQYSVLDRKISLLQEYEKITKSLYDWLHSGLSRKEKEKREELEKSINDIFLQIFNIDISLSLNEDYGITLTSSDSETLNEFENSTSQDAIMAFSFIGGIIKIARNNRNKRNSQNATDLISDEELQTEPYPLVMDAPSSSFDIERIEHFCKIMPNIAEQVIFFIKDTDGNYVKKDLLPIIGKEYAMDKVSKTQTIVREVR